MLKTYKNVTMKLSAALMSGVAMGFSSEVMAGQFNDYTSTLSERTNSVPNVVSFLCYLGGAVLAALGIVGLKQHVENPGNAPMKNGLAKLGFGGMLIALPTITDVMLTTADAGNEATFQNFTDQNF